MEDLSLHIMDIVENSFKAGAKKIVINLIENGANNLVLEIEDDGKGIEEGLLENIIDPFYTTKSDKKYGLGLSLLAQACEETGGRLKIEKGVPRGLKVTASFKKDNVDLKPLGDINKTVRVFQALHPEIVLKFKHKKNDR